MPYLAKQPTPQGRVMQSRVKSWRRTSLRPTLPPDDADRIAERQLVKLMTDFLAAVAAEFQIIVRDRAGLPGGPTMS